MRLYKLISRVGKRKKRLWPWFDPPAAEAPMKYYGWVWDPEKEDWIKKQVKKVKTVVNEPKYPKPTEKPRPEQTLYEPGWYWNGRSGVWEEIPLTPQELSEGLERGPKPEWPPGHAYPEDVLGWHWDWEYEEWCAVIYGERITEFEVPQPLPPDITEEQVRQLAYVGVDLDKIIQVMDQPWLPPVLMTNYELRQLMMMLEKSGYSRLGAAEVLSKYQMLTKAMPAEQIQKVWSQAAQSIIRTWRRSHQINTSVGQRMWAEGVAKHFGMKPDPTLRWFVAAALMWGAACFGISLGNLLESLVTPEEELCTLKEDKWNYLLGPGNWEYSRLIGRTIRGRTYYSKCMGIGTEYVRHKRQRGKIGYDVIDFPGGFVETGYKFPHYVKYNWSHWALQYIGMLESVSVSFYRLKKADVDPYATMRGHWMLPVEDWCKGFDWYL